MAFAACQKENISEDPGTTSSDFVAYSESDASAKTSMDTNFNVLWSQGDEVSIFVGSTINQRFRTTSYGSTSTPMELIDDGGFVAGSELPCNVAVYPYSKSLTIKKADSGYYVGSVVIPSMQTYAEASFSNGASPMIAVTSGTADKALKFKNVCGGINFRLTGSAKIKSVSFSGNDGEVISGSADVIVSNTSFPSLSMNTGGSTSIILDCGNGVQLNETTPTSFYLVLPPMVMSHGFTAVVTDVNGHSMTLSTAKVQAVSRSTILNMPAKEFDGVPVEEKTPLNFTAVVAGTTISLVKHGEFDDVPQEYSTDGLTWKEYTFGDDIRLANIGDKVYFRKLGEGVATGFSLDSPRYYGFSIIGKAAASGCVMSLIDKTCQTTTIPRSACFNKLFMECSGLTSAPEMPATTLSTFCYHRMFLGCSSLLEAPELPATTIKHGCYESMFEGCTKLVYPPALPAEKLENSCYSGMFYGCVSLKTAPELPATELVDGCYDKIFFNCRKISYLKVGFEDWCNGACTGAWVGGVSAQGVFECPENLEVRYSSDYVPNGWRVSKNGEIIDADQQDTIPMPNDGGSVEPMPQMTIKIAKQDGEGVISL